MAGVSPGASSFSADSAPSIDTLKDLHDQCIANFELLCADPSCSNSRWREQLVMLREWGSSLFQESYDPSVFINRLRDSAPLRDAVRNHLTALLAILRQGKAPTSDRFGSHSCLGGRLIFLSYLCSRSHPTTDNGQFPIPSLPSQRRMYEGC